MLANQQSKWTWALESKMFLKSEWKQPQHLVRVTTGSHLLQARCKGGLFHTTGHKLALGLLHDEHQNQIKNQQQN